MDPVSRFSGLIGWWQPLLPSVPLMPMHQRETWSLLVAFVMRMASGLAELGESSVSMHWHWTRPRLMTWMLTVLVTSVTSGVFLLKALSGVHQGIDPCSSVFLD